MAVSVIVDVFYDKINDLELSDMILGEFDEEEKEILDRLNQLQDEATVTGGRRLIMWSLRHLWYDLTR